MCINVSSYFGRNAVVLWPTRAGCMQQVVFGDLNGRIGTALLAARLCSGICTVSDAHHSARKANFSVYGDDRVFFSAFNLQIIYNRFCPTDLSDYKYSIRPCKNRLCLLLSSKCRVF